MPKSTTRTTPLGVTSERFSETILAIMALGDLMPPSTFGAAFANNLEPSPAASDMDAPALLATVRALFGAVRKAKLTARTPIAFAIGPLPIAIGQPEREIRVDILQLPEGVTAADYAEDVAARYPTVLAIAFSRIDAVGAMCQSGRMGAPVDLTGIVACAALGDEYGERQLARSWILLDGDDTFELCVDDTTKVTPAEA